MDPQHQIDKQLQSPQPPGEDMIACVMRLEAALLPCLPARELQAIDRSPHPSHQTRLIRPHNCVCYYLSGEFRQKYVYFEVLAKLSRHLLLTNVLNRLSFYWIASVDVERHARDFMEAAKKLQLYFISLQREDQPTKAETLKKEIAVMEEELKMNSEIVRKQERLVQGWRKELKDQLDKHNIELERV